MWLVKGKEQGAKSMEQRAKGRERVAKEKSVYFFIIAVFEFLILVVVLLVVKQTFDNTGKFAGFQFALPEGNFPFATGVF